jgi:hypothetical protein
MKVDTSSLDRTTIGSLLSRKLEVIEVSALPTQPRRFKDEVAKLGVLIHWRIHAQWRAIGTKIESLVFDTMKDETTKIVTVE